MKPLRHLRALQAFDTAASQSSVSRAAAVLGVSHGAVSRQIKLLEQYLGLLLFHRRSTGVELTDAGQRLHGVTRQAFQALRDGVDSVKREPAGRSVTVSLAASLATKWLVPRLAAYRSLHPGTALFLDTNDDVVDFDRSEVDVALRYGSPPWRGLHVERLVEEDLVVVATRSLTAGRCRPLSPEEIAGLPLLHDRFNPAWDTWAEAVGLNPADLVPAEIEFQDSAVLIAAALDGQGVALARRLLVADDLDADRLIRLDETSVPSGRGLYFVCRTGDQERPAIRSFRNWLFSLLEER